MSDRDRDTGSSHQIREHYDSLSHAYLSFWGEHIHHGYWEANESPKRAQLKLIEKLAELARVPFGGRVLDVGCGLGGSSMWLARHLGCQVTGVRLSPVQAELARCRARRRRLHHLVNFEVANAENLAVAPGTFDAIWVIEASEHFQNKPEFFHNCHRALKPGGVLALCAWLAGHEGFTESGRCLLDRILRAMLCPSLGTFHDHVRWISAAGFELCSSEDITANVEKTWSLCSGLSRLPPVKALLRAADPPTRDFVSCFGDMQRAYAERIMAYGMFAARKVQ